MADLAKPTNVQQNAAPAVEAKKPPFQRPKAKGVTKIPVPKHLSKTETPLTNDPLWKDSFVLDGESGLTSVEPAKEFNADASGYIAIVDAEYKAIGDVERHYAKAIPASAHAYYHGILYWYELAIIAQKRGIASLDQERLIRFVEGYTTAPIAAGAGEYLHGVTV